MQISFKSQLIVAELDTFYKCLTPKEIPMPDGSFSPWYQKGFWLNTWTGSPRLLYTYEFLKEEGIDLGISAEDKKKLWEMAKIKFNTENVRLIKHPQSTKEYLQGELHKVFKSILVKAFLCHKFYEENIVLKILNAETNKEIKLLRWAQEKN